jgi:hypothetical protein
VDVWEWRAKMQYPETSKWAKIVPIKGKGRRVYEMHGSAAEAHTMMVHKQSRTFRVRTVGHMWRYIDV